MLLVSENDLHLQDNLHEISMTLTTKGQAEMKILSTNMVTSKRGNIQGNLVCLTVTIHQVFLNKKNKLIEVT